MANWQILSGTASAGGTVTIDEFPLPSPASTFGMAADHDGSTWFTASFPVTVGHVSPSGNITEYPIATTAQSLSGIVVGPDNNIWFGEWSNPGGAPPLNRIGRMSRAGDDFQEFIVPPSIHGSNYFHNPHYLIVGPDGNIWFTVGEDALGRVTTSGDISLFYLPPSRCAPVGQEYGHPYGLTVGPDGALWLAVQIGNALLRFDIVSEQFQVVPIAPCGTPADATNLTTGPDGNLWVTDFGNSQVFRVSLSGQVATFSVPGAPFGVVAASGGIFVTRFDHQFNEISRIDLSTGAVLDDYPIPTPASGPENMTVDPAGNVWFNEQDGQNIGRLNNPSPCVDALTLTYDAGALNMHFALGSEAPALWGVWLAFDHRVVPLWIVGIRPVSPAVFFNVPTPGFPGIGNVGVLTVLFTSTSHTCGDWKVVDTGGVGPTAQALKTLIMSKGSARSSPLDRAPGE